MLKWFHSKRFCLTLTLGLTSLCQSQGQDIHKALREQHKPCSPNKDGEMDFSKNSQPAEILSITGETQFCVNGVAGGFKCSNIDLQSFLNITDLGGGSDDQAGGSLNDIWGWTSETSGIEYVLVGVASGTIFVDISNPTIPIVLGRLKTHSSFSQWFDVKTYSNHAFIVSEAKEHGMQVYDLTQLDLLSRESPDMNLFETAHYNGVSNSHNIVINEESGFAYLVGTNTCRAGLHMVDISTPTNPQFVGCFSKDGYVHDAHCVIYNGPDTEYVGKEVCFCSNEDTVTIVDVSDKNNPSLISKLRYDFSRLTYTHQGWLTEDHKIMMMDDELKTGPTTTYILDLSDLDEPIMKTQFCQDFGSSAHNQYVKGSRTYQANYHSGLRIFDNEPLMNTDGNIEEIAFFDTYTPDDDFGFDGAWSNYPWFKSGNVVVSGIEEGLFVLRPHFNYNSSVIVRHLDAIIVDDESINYKLSQSIRVTVTIHDHTNSPVEKATVTGHFYNGIKKAACVTNTSGTCVINSKSISGGINDISFSVQGIVLPRHRYENKNNTHSTIRVKKSGQKYDIIKSKNIPIDLKKRSNLWSVSKLFDKLNSDLEGVLKNQRNDTVF